MRGVLLGQPVRNPTPITGGATPPVYQGPCFNTYVANKTVGSGGDYVDGDVWLRGGVYYVNPFDLSTSTYKRAFDGTKPNGNWLRIREWDGPGTVTFDLRPESAASDLGQTQTQAYNDAAHGGAFQNVFGTSGSFRWAFDAGIIFSDGAIHLTTGADRLVFHRTSHTDPITEWRRQWDVIRTIRGVSDPGSYIPNDGPSSFGGTGPSGGGPYFQTWFDARFKGNFSPTAFRLEGATRIYIIAVDAGHLGDDGLFTGDGSDRIITIGSAFHSIDNADGGYQGAGPAAWLHNDDWQFTGAMTNSAMYDCTLQGHALEAVAESGQVHGLIVDRCWQGVAGAPGGDIGMSNGFSIDSASKIGSGAPTTRLSGHYYKVFSNGMQFSDGDPQLGYAINGGGANWHTGLVLFASGSGAMSASVSVTVAVPTGVTVNPTTGFITSGTPSFLASTDAPHQRFLAAYGADELDQVLADYGIPLD